MAREQVVWRLVDIHRPVTNISTGDEYLAETLVANGVWLNTDEGIDTPEEKFNVRQEDLDRLERIGAFEPVPPPPEVEPPPDNFGKEPDDPDAIELLGNISPIPLEDLADWQIEEFVKTHTTEDIIAEVGKASDKERLAQRVLKAENDITGGEQREDLVQGLADSLSRGVTENDGESSPDSGGGGTASGPPEPPEIQGEPPVDPADVEVTEAVQKYATEHDIDLSQITGTGTGGRITMLDVSAWEKAQGL
jgi:pyruvate/2-oxoglutarate dehydrogenase complex dihydrolipoamide acyltransferase (E2) component